MLKFIRRSSKKAGLPPGSLVHTGEARTEKVRVTVIDYDEQNIQEREVEDLGECLSYRDKPSVTWINIDGVHQTSVIEEIGEQYGVHPLVLEDIASTGQRPKLEDFRDYVFVVLNMLSLDEAGSGVQAEQVSIILGSNFVVSFQERPGDVFDHVRERIRNARGRIRKMGADYLMYALLDAVVDNYFLILEKLGERIENMEEDLVSDPTPALLKAVHNLKRELIYLRKSVWPLREVLSQVLRGETSLVQEATSIFLRDVYDHTIQVIDTVETFRDMASGMVDMYMSSVSNRMNEVMKVLTIIATIFIPLTFIAGIYGMNFEHMPELKWGWAYPAALAVMAAVAVVMIIYFRRKRWL
jgi:magnesium transporter